MKRRESLSQALLLVLIVLTSLLAHNVIRAQKAAPKAGSANADRQAQLVVQLGNSGADAVAISVDGKYVVTSNNHTARLWKTESGREIRRFVGHSGSILSVAFSADGKYVVTAGNDHSARLWEVITGKEVRKFVGHSDSVLSLAISADSKYVLTSGDNTVRLWETETGKEIHRFAGHKHWVWSVAISADNKYVLTGSRDKTARLWDAETGSEVHRFKVYSGVSSVLFSPDGKYVLTVCSGEVKLWELKSGREVRKLDEYSREVVFSADGKYMLTGDGEGAQLWETETGREVRKFVGYSDSILSAAFSADGKYVVTGSLDHTARLWEMDTGREARKFVGHSYPIVSLTISADSKYVVTGSSDATARLWEVETGKEMRKFVGHSDGVNSVAISVDGKYIATGGIDGTARLWEVETGREVRRFEHSGIVGQVAISADGKYVVTGSTDQTARLWEVETDKEVQRFLGHSGSISSVAFSRDRKYLLTSSRDSTTRLWDIYSGKEKCSLVSFLDGNWAVIDPDGRYDASNGGDIEGMHWAVGNEIIELSQLKHRYYEPKLLASILKQETLRDVSAFKNVKLFPDVVYDVPAPGSTQLKIKLTNRGGGIGPVAVFVNDKEVTADARGPGPNSHADMAELAVDLAGAASFKPGEKNDIRVLAYNAEGWLSSRGPVVTWNAPGEAVKDPPALYAIIGGVSTYSAESVNLRYAAKDAEDMAKALRLGAKNLFGSDKTHITVLSTSGNTGTVRPTKENFRKAFEAARKAKPGDVLVVYLVGHGLAVKLSGENDTYCYLTEEWRGGTNLNDEAVRREQAVTSDELVEWIKQVPALKQIMMLDTCAAGAAAEKLSLIAKRLPSSDQVRAIDRLKGRTGFHVLMGAAADKVSYETSQFNQGLLTRALLEGMKYGAVKNERVEVSDLFQYARDRVPVIARESGIGGVQQPQIMAPKADSFPVARMTSRESEEIFLTRAKPFVMRPRIINSADVDDDELEKGMRRALRDESEPMRRGTEGKESRLVYLDDGELPSAVRPSGTFTVVGDRIKVTITLKRGEQRASFEIEGTKRDIAALSSKIIEQMAEALKALR